MRLAYLAQDSKELFDQFCAFMQGVADSELPDGSTYTMPKSFLWSPGEISWDRPCFAMYLGTLDQGEPNGADANVLVPEAAHFSISVYAQITRPIAKPQAGSGQVPLVPAEIITRDGMTSLTDAQYLTQAAVAVWKQRKSVRRGQSYKIGPTHPIGPAGGMNATRLQLRMSVH